MLFSVMNVLSSIYENNKSKARELSCFLENNLATVKEEIGKAEAELIKLKKQKEELSEESAKLEEARGHLQIAYEEAKILKARIDSLSDSRLNEALAEKERLSCELKERKKRSEAIQDELHYINKEMLAVKEKIKESIKSAANYYKEIETLEFDLRKQEAHKNKLELSIADLIAKSAEYYEWIGGFDKRILSLKENEERLDDITRMLEAVWNSEKNQSFAKDKLLGSDDVKELFSPKDAVAWFAQRQKDIEHMLDEYRQKLAAVIKISENLTSQSPHS
ncbi:MAG: hypothetical protein LBU32_03880 [Clostridiales bacterium]|nr:hypothetical protein [Clostridiales bacterium]